MKKLSKDQQARYRAIMERLDAAKQEVETQVTAYNEQKSKLFGLVEAAINHYNEVVADFESLREEVHSDMESFFEERSEKWQEGDAGQSYSEWKDQWAEEQAEHELQETDDVEVDLNGSEQIDSQYPFEPGDT